jgi:light-regulated signal transduction histidine kinase (bacteriophytochrome)
LLIVAGTAASWYGKDNHSRSQNSDQDGSVYSKASSGMYAIPYSNSKTGYLILFYKMLSSESITFFFNAR